MSVLPNYQVKFRNHAGALKGLYAGAEQEGAGLVSVVYELRENGIHQHAMTIKGDISFADELARDWFVDCVRLPLGSVNYATDYTGFHRSLRREADANGAELFTSLGFGFNHLLKRRVLRSHYSLNGKSEAVAKEAVAYNAGPSAGTVTDSITSTVYSRPFPGLSVEVDAGRGESWEGERENFNLLEVVTEVANAADQYFDVVADVNPATFVFRWYESRGTDRTVGNVGGNDPVIFSLERNNVLTPVSIEDYANEVTMIYLSGKDTGGGPPTRQVGAASTVIQASPWNLIELFRPTPTDSANAALDVYGQAELEELRAYTRLQFTAQQTYASAYGTHYFMGDKVTVYYHGRYDVRIAGVRVEANENGETIALILDDAIMTRQSATEIALDRIAKRTRRLEAVAK